MRHLYNKMLEEVDKEAVEKEGELVPSVTDIRCDGVPMAPDCIP